MVKPSGEVDNVKLSKTQAILCQVIKSWGIYYSSIASDVRIAHVIRHNKNNVWLDVRLLICIAAC